MPAASAARARRTALRSRCAPAGAHLQRHRHAVRRAGGDHRLDDRERQRLVLHQRRAGPLVADLLGRAAHVDVDDLRAAVDVVGARPRPSSPRRCRRSAPRSAPASPSWSARRAGLQAGPQVLARGHHLAHRVAGAEALAQLAERPVGHARHRRDEQAVRQRDVADAHGEGRRRAAEKRGSSIAARVSALKCLRMRSRRIAGAAR